MARHTMRVARRESLIRQAADRWAWIVDQAERMRTDANGRVIRQWRKRGGEGE
jgi:hypothetical protein